MAQRLPPPLLLMQPWRLLPILLLALLRLHLPLLLHSLQLRLKVNKLSQAMKEGGAHCLPFFIDLNNAMAKHSKKDFAPHISHGKAPRCEAHGCTKEGAYKAPKARNSLHDYRYFCLEHARDHNQKWDYFAGMSEAEIEAFRKDAVTGHRPTWERLGNIPNPHEKLYAAVNDFLHTGGRRKTKDVPHVSAKVRKALAIFEIEYPYTAATLKNQYKKLVKRTHPDHHQGDRLAEEKFKAVTSAHKILDAHLHEF